MKKGVYRKAGLVFFIVLIFLLLPYQVFADTWEYYTYGGYNAVVDAWRKVGLIFSDNAFKGLYFSAIVLGAIVLYFMVLARATFAGAARFNLTSWAVPVLLGASIYVAFIVPKDQIVVYDTVLNRGPETIGNIPKIMAMTAGLLNKIEKGMIDIVRVSSSPVEDYAQNAGGTGFVILSQFGDPMTISMAGVPMYVHQTAYQFIKDCLIFELGRNGTTLTAQDINSGKVDFVAAIKAAENPGVPTVYYDESGKEVDTNPNGSEVTCYDAGEKLITYINNNINAIVASTCAMSGYNIDVPQEWNACRTLVESTYVNGLSGATGSSGNLNLLAAQSFFAYSLINTLNSLNPESSIKLMATKEAASQYLGLAIHANTWLPVIKETLRTVAIAISPFVLLFAATPLVGRALGFLLGMMVWVVTWTVIDAILHYAAVSQAIAVSKEFTNVIANGVPGTMFFVLLPSYSSKVAAVFGAIRWAGLGLATVLTGMLIKFGGAALAMVAGSITGAAQSAGAAMGRMVTDITSPIRADLIPTRSWTNAAFADGGISALAEGLAEFQSGSLVGQSRAGAYLGAGKIEKSTFLSNVETVSRNVALGSPEIAEKTGEIAGQQLLGSTEAMLELERLFGPDLAKRIGKVETQTRVGNVLGKEDLAREYKTSLVEMFRDTAKGAQYKEKFYQNPLRSIVQASDGKWYVIDVNTNLLSANVKQLEEQSYQTLHERVQGALKRMSFDELTRFFDENKHVFSKEHREAIENLLRTVKEQGVVEKHGYQEETYDKNYAGYGGELGGSVRYGDGGGRAIGPSAFGRTGRESSEVFRTTDGRENVTRDNIIKALSKAITDSVSNQDSHAVGKAFEKLFKNQEEFNEAMKAAEQYKEIKSLETAISVNALPVVIQRIGDKYYSQYDVIGLNDRYSMAVRDLIQAVHSGNAEEIRKFTQEFEKVQKEYATKVANEVFPDLSEGIKLKADVKAELNKEFQDLYAQGPRPSTAKGWEWEGPVVEKDAEKISQNLPKPKGPRARKRR